MSYKHTKTFERKRIEVLSKMRSSPRQIVGQLNRHQSSLVNYNEITISFIQ